MDFAGRTAHELYNRWRGFQPWPGAFTSLDSKKLIVHRMAIASRESGVAATFQAVTLAEPGQIRFENSRLFAACAGNTWIELIELQLEGKKRIGAAEFLRGSSILAKARLGTANS